MARFWGSSTLWVAGAADTFTAGKTSQAEVRRTDGGSKEEAKRGRSTRSRLECWVRGEGAPAWHLIWFCQLTHMQVHERLHQEVRSWQEGNRQWLPASATFPRPGWSQSTRGGMGSLALCRAVGETVQPAKLGGGESCCRATLPSEMPKALAGGGQASRQGLAQRGSSVTA